MTVPEKTILTTTILREPVPRSSSSSPSSRLSHWLENCAAPVRHSGQSENYAAEAKQMATAFPLLNKSIAPSKITKARIQKRRRKPPDPRYMAN